MQDSRMSSVLLGVDHDVQSSLDLMRDEIE